MKDIKDFCIEQGIPDDHMQSVEKIIAFYENQIAEMDAEDARVRIGADDIINQQAKKYKDLQWKFEMLKQTVRNANHPVSGEIMVKYRNNVFNQKMLIRDNILKRRKIEEQSCPDE